MRIDRKISTKTWNRIDEVARRIWLRAGEANDADTVRDADLIIGLLRSLASEIQMEDDNAAA
jgi:hypothetical protein